jgi:glucose uptake protein GlcU
MSPYDRFLSWKNLAYAVGAILLGRIAYTLYAVYAQGLGISWYEHIYPVIMDIVAPGSMQIQYMLEYGVRQLPDNTTNPI